MLNKSSSIATEEVALNPNASISCAASSALTTLFEALSRDLMAKMQYIGNAVRVSQLKHHKFKKIIAVINQKREEKAEVYRCQQGLGEGSELPPELSPLDDLILYRHIVNRWGTALAMLGQGLYLQEVSVLIICQDPTN